jgi:hypothetical protein
MPARTPAGDVVAKDFEGKPTHTSSLGAQGAGGEAAVVGAASLRRKDDVSMNPKKVHVMLAPPQNRHLSQVTTPRVTCFSTPTDLSAGGRLRSSHSCALIHPLNNALPPCACTQTSHPKPQMLLDDFSLACHRSHKHSLVHSRLLAHLTGGPRGLQTTTASPRTRAEGTCCCKSSS